MATLTFRAYAVSIYLSLSNTPVWCKQWVGVQCQIVEVGATGIKQLYPSIDRPHVRQMASLESVPKVDVDPSGVFKYILIKVYGQEKNNTEPFVTIVRGYQRCEYHSDILDEVQEKLKPLDCECIGGGRISHEPEQKKMHIYGYSQGFGKADHEVTAKIIQEAYPSYIVSLADDGY